MLTTDDIIKATGGELLTENPRTFSGVSIDSRTIGEGELFFAIRGERFDGHDFLDEALLKGGGAVVDSRPAAIPVNRLIICVKDTLRALQDFAHFLRMKMDIPVIAVTGSNGKTTTKEMLYSILSRRFKTLKNEGNLNNHIGLPLSLMRLESDHDIVVLEMGMSAAGEIRKLCEIAVPTHGVITNIGSAHLGMLGSHEAIRNAKLEILERVEVAVLNADDSFLMRGISEGGKFKGEIVTFSINNESHVMAKDVQATGKGSSFNLEFKGEGVTAVDMNLHGVFNIYNALAASAVCFSLGIKIDEIKAALEGFRPFPMRFEITESAGMTLINDSYNANPSSMEGSLRELTRTGTGGRRVAVLGDMLELNEFSEIEHRNLGRLITEMNVDVFIAVGEMMNMAAEECIRSRSGRAKPEVYTFRNADDAGNEIMNILNEGDTVLVKGSRSTRMEKIAGRITHAV
jgi:UDP-N-acetylmuramoyl-tripeptide--D-alanyl-D-alanine ligase